MKKLSLALVAAILIGCGSEGAKAADKAPLEVQVRSGEVIITSLEEGLKIYNMVVNRGNCGTSWKVYSKDGEYLFKFDAKKNENSVEVKERKYDKTIETLPMLDFYDKYGKDNALELNFGKVIKISWFWSSCDPIEVEIETNKDTWTFSFR
nr:hypothetical protein [uncultured Campylobacter sp.]